jgi:HK97 family phage portal protein
MFTTIFRPTKTRAAVSTSDLWNPRLWLKKWAEGGVGTAAGMEVSPTTAMGLSGYYGAMRAIAEDIGKLPLITYKRLDPKGKERAAEHSLFRLLHDFPNPNMESMTFRETLTHWTLGWGNGYAEIERNGLNVPTALYPIHPSRVIVEDKDARNIYYNVLNDDYTRVQVPQRDMFHVRGLGAYGLYGYSVARVAAESIGVNLAAQSFGAAFFGNGTHLAGVLEHPGTLDPDGLKSLRESWADMNAGVANAYKPGILEEGMTWKRIGIPPEEAQFIESRQFGVEEMARWFRIPPHKIQHLLRATFSNIDAQNIEYVTDTLLPWITRWEQQIQRKLFGEEEEEYFAEHLVVALLRGDLKTQAEYYAKLQERGVLSINEIREAENRNPIEGGDKHFIGVNMQEVTEDTGEEEKDPKEERDQTPPPKPFTSEEIKLTMFPALRAAASRVIRKEEKAVTRASSRYNGDSQAFQVWMEKFYGEHETFVTEAFSGLLQSISLMAKRPIDERFLQRFSVGHCKLSRDLLTKEFEAKTVKTSTRFSDDYVQLLAKVFFEEALEDGAVWE